MYEGERMDYITMTEDELAEERIRLDEEMQALRMKKKSIQEEIDRRRSVTQNAYTIMNAGGIESEEGVGNE